VDGRIAVWDVRDVIAVKVYVNAFGSSFGLCVVQAPIAPVKNGIAHF
jgi:hypothetical protein